MQREQDHPHNSKLHASGTVRRGKGTPRRLHRHDLDRFSALRRRVLLQFLIPSEMMAVVALGDLEEIERDVYHNVDQSPSAAKTLRDEVQDGIQTYGLRSDAEIRLRLCL